MNKTNATATNEVENIIENFHTLLSISSEESKRKRASAEELQAATQIIKEVQSNNDLPQQIDILLALEKAALAHDFYIAIQKERVRGQLTMLSDVKFKWEEGQNKEYVVAWYDKVWSGMPKLTKPIKIPYVDMLINIFCRRLSRLAKNANTTIEQDFYATRIKSLRMIAKVYRILINTHLGLIINKDEPRKIKTV